eukprot:626188-Alexandrium_andersonii.AAC.1
MIVELMPTASKPTRHVVSNHHLLTTKRAGVLQGSFKEQGPKRLGFRRVHIWRRRGRRIVHISKVFQRVGGRSWEAT